MDPNATLKEIRALISQWEQSSSDDDLSNDFAADLVDYIQALDDWISKGGFLPSAWQRPHMR